MFRGRNHISPHAPRELVGKNPYYYIELQRQFLFLHASYTYDQVNRKQHSYKEISKPAANHELNSTEKYEKHRIVPYKEKVKETSYSSEIHISPSTSEFQIREHN